MKKITYRINTNIAFTDKETGETVRAGSLFKTADYDRAKDIMRRNIGKFAGVEHPKRKGNRILIHQKYCYKIGGIETANRAIAEAFKDRNIVFVFGDADFDQAMELAQYHEDRKSTRLNSSHA